MAGRRRRAPGRGLAALLALALVPACAAGQAPPVPKDRPADPSQDMTGELLRELEARLSLSAEQKAQIVRLKKTFQAKHRDELKRLRQDVQRLRREMQLARQARNTLAVRQVTTQARALRREAAKLHAEFEAELFSVLTDAQKQQYQAIKKERARPGGK